ncbi:MAG: hypothetical protein OXG78_01320 [Chloroflexi bacterium]|nr:hypothetical protein [Chloroflexota bacterium]
MLRFLRSLTLGLLLGALVGIYFGWVLFPAESRRSRLSDLSPPYRDEYSVMVAAGYVSDADPQAAIARISRLASEDVPGALRDTTERIILTSSRDLDDIALLVHLAEGLGQSTEAMQPFLGVHRERA